MNGDEPRESYTVLAFRANLNNVDRMELEKRRTEDRQIFEIMHIECSNNNYILCRQVEYNNCVIVPSSNNSNDPLWILKIFKRVEYDKMVSNHRAFNNNLRDSENSGILSTCSLSFGPAAASNSPSIYNFSYSPTSIISEDYDIVSQLIEKHLFSTKKKETLSVVSNGNDMYKYLYNLLHVLNPVSSSYTGSPKIDIEIQELINPQNIYDYDYDTGFGPGQTYSFGWYQGVFHNTKIYHHGGAMYGFSSFILLIPSIEFGIFAIDNKYKGAANVVYAVREIITTLFFNDAKSSELHQRMLLESSQLTNELNRDNGDNNDIIYPGRTSRSRRRRGLSSSTTSPISLQKYVGTYRHPAYGVFIIKLNTKQNGLLYSRPLSSDSNFYELVFVRDHIFKPKLRPNTSFQYGKWLYFVDDPSGNIVFFLSQLANGKSTGANIAPIAFMKQGIKNPLANKWVDQEFRKLPFQFPRDDL
eukprot:g4901.t1